MKNSLFLSCLLLITGISAFSQGRLPVKKQFVEGHSSPNTHRPITVRSFSADKTTAIKQGLDSIRYNEYDPQSGQWGDPSKDVYTYDANGNLTLEESYETDAATGSYYLYGKDTYAYDANNNNTQYINYQWDSNLSLVVAKTKWDYTYNSSNWLILEKAYTFNNTTQQFELSGKYDHSYDVSGNKTSYVYSAWNGSSYVPTNKTSYTYTAASKVLQELSYTWDSGMNQWGTALSKKDYTYDTNNRLIEDIFSQYVNSQWEASSRYTYSYNANGKRAEDVYYNQWVVATGTWVGNNKTAYTYDSNNNCVQYLYSDWDAATSAWVVSNREKSVYDNTYTFNDLVIPFLYDAEITEMFSHMLTDFTSDVWEATTSQWEPSSKSKFYYSQRIISGVADASAEPTICVLPNPAQSQLTFKGMNAPAEVRILDIQGKTLLSKQVANGESIDIQALGNGIYFYQLQHNGKTLSGKFVKE